MADIEEIAKVLLEASKTHHTVYRISDGDDPDWASWYAEWLLDLSELPKILGTTPVRSELVWILVGASKEFNTGVHEESWEDFYAARIARHFSTPPG